MIRVLDSADSTLVEWGRQQQQQHDDYDGDDYDGDDNDGGGVVGDDCDGGDVDDDGGDDDDGGGDDDGGIGGDDDNGGGVGGGDNDDDNGLPERSCHFSVPSHFRLYIIVHLFLFYNIYFTCGQADNVFHCCNVRNYVKSGVVLNTKNMLHNIYS